MFESELRNVAMLGSRAVLGGYMVAHGAQKLFGSFGGKGIAAAAEDFAPRGLAPGRPLAVTASAMELGGGILTATGAAAPLGPLMIMGSMAVAATTKRPNGPFAATMGYELPLTNVALSAALAVAGPGRFACGRPLSKALTTAATAVGAGVAAALVRQVLLAQHAPERSGAAGSDLDRAPVDPSGEIRGETAEWTIAASAWNGNPPTAGGAGASDESTGRGGHEAA